MCRLHSLIACVLIAPSILTSSLGLAREALDAHGRVSPPERSSLHAYGRFGTAYDLNGDLGSAGGAVGFGLRLERHRFGIDLSGYNLHFDHDGGELGFEADMVNGSAAKILALCSFQHHEPLTLYVGAGLSLGWAGTVADGKVYDSGGRERLQGELSCGFSGNRRMPLRPFVQMDLTLPFYTAGQDGQTRYAPFIVVSLGLAVGGSWTAR